MDMWKDTTMQIMSEYQVRGGGKVPVGRPRNTWQDTLFADTRLLKVDPQDVHDGKKWRAEEGEWQMA